MVDFLFMFTEPFSLGVTDEVIPPNRLKISFLEGAGSLAAKFSGRRRRPPEIFALGTQMSLTHTHICPGGEYVCKMCVSNAMRSDRHLN